MTRTSADEGKIEALAAVLRRAEPVEDHKCGDIGRITFRSRDGSETSLGILPAHDRTHYEYRDSPVTRYDDYRVDRAAFLRAMAALGFDRVALKAP